jgi:hypothetical protein
MSLYSRSFYVGNWDNQFYSNLFNSRIDYTMFILLEWDWKVPLLPQSKQGPIYFIGKVKNYVVKPYLDYKTNLQVLSYLFNLLSKSS